MTVHRHPSRHNISRISAVLVMISVVVLGGCAPIGLVAGAFSLGTLFGQAAAGSTPVRIVLERTCYRNGEIVDCSTLQLAAQP